MRASVPGSLGIYNNRLVGPIANCRYAGRVAQPAADRN